MVDVDGSSLCTGGLTAKIVDLISLRVGGHLTNSYAVIPSPRYVLKFDWNSPGDLVLSFLSVRTEQQRNLLFRVFGSK